MKKIIRKFKRMLKRTKINLYRYITVKECIDSIDCSNCNSKNTTKCDKYLKRFKWVI